MQLITEYTKEYSREYAEIKRERIIKRKWRYLNDEIFIKDEDERLISDIKKIKERWKCYFKELLIKIENYRRTNSEHEEEEIETEVTGPSKEEIVELCSKLKNNRSPRILEITPEMIKEGKDKLQQIYKLIKQMWKKKLPND